MAKVDVSSYKDFGQICDRLDDIIGQVRSKDTSLERSLDLFDEAIALGSKAVSMVDSTDITPEEEARLIAENAENDGAADEEGTAPADGAAPAGDADAAAGSTDASNADDSAAHEGAEA